MANVNKIILVGRLTADPELRNQGMENAMAKFTLAVDRPRRPDGTPGETDFIDIISFGRQAENVSKYCSKGKLVLSEGRMQVRTYTDASGTKKWVTEVVANSVLFLSGASSSPTTGASDITAPSEEHLNSAPSEEPLPATEDIPF